jgi:hypothetical protein
MSEVLNSWIFYGLVMLTLIVAPDLRASQERLPLASFVKDQSRLLPKSDQCFSGLQEMLVGNSLRMMPVSCCVSSGPLNCTVKWDSKGVRW